VRLGTPATPSNKFRNQKHKAKHLQKKLESEQQQGEAEAARLQEQAAALEGEQATLEGEEAALEAESAGLESERSQLEASGAHLAQQRTIRAQLETLVGEAERLAAERARVAAQAAALREELAAVRALERETEARLAGNLTPDERARLEARLQRLEGRESDLEPQLQSLDAEQHSLARQSEALAQRAAQLRAQAAALGADAASLAAEATAAASEALSLSQQKDALEQSSAAAQVQAANLQTQEAQLQTQQVKAQAQEKQAKQLKQELTKELTNAGGDDRGTDPRLVKLQRGLTQTSGVKLVSPPQINDSGDASIFTVIPTTAPAATETADLVQTFRDYVIPQRTAGMDLHAHVGGSTASYVDLASAISSKLALVIAAVIALGFVVLMTAFRSMLVPAQAALANLLSVMAAFGVLTACFQYGWGLGLVGLETSSGTVPIASFVPLIMFAVLFGLSMDYQVFLMTQIEQHRAGGADGREAIAAGLATGARVITAAALIMIAVFASFILNGDPTVKQFGVGLSVGVALAAMSVLALAPALLALAGRGSWWVPGWADRHLPHVDIEGAASAASPATATADE
jgi:uncharacterized membrane protein YdfJ with MMPL/SSD domain